MVISFFESSPSYSFDGSILELKGADATLILEKYVPTPLVPLAGTNQVLVFTEALGDGANRSTGNLGMSIKPTLRFEEDGSFAVDTECNQGSGTYETSGDQMTLTFTSLTDESCSAGTSDFFWSHKDEHILSILEGNPTFSLKITP